MAQWWQKEVAPELFLASHPCMPVRRNGREGALWLLGGTRNLVVLIQHLLAQTWTWREGLWAGRSLLVPWCQPPFRETVSSQWFWAAALRIPEEPNVLGGQESHSADRGSSAGGSSQPHACSPALPKEAALPSRQAGLHWGFLSTASSPSQPEPRISSLQRASSGLCEMKRKAR